MKLKLITATIFGLGLSSMAHAAYTPPTGPLYIQFSNVEQISASNSIVAPSGAHEGNWGVFEVSNIAKGDINSSTTDWNPISPSVWNNETTDGAEITGMWWGVTNLASSDCPTGAAICANGGFLDLFWDKTPDAQLGIATPLDRTSDNTFNNFTDGDFLVRLAFASGIATGNPLVDIIGSTAPTNSLFVGLANSYLNVADKNADGVIDSNDGLWAKAWDTDYFNTAFGKRDVRLRNVYNDMARWNGAPGSDVFGAESSDPLRVMTVPEPASMSIFGLGLLGMGALRRRKHG